MLSCVTSATMTREDGAMKWFRTQLCVILLATTGHAAFGQVHPPPQSSTGNTVP